MNGFEVARRARAINPDLKVIYCTANTELEPEEIGDAFGPLLKKPFTNGSLIALLEYVQTFGSSEGENVADVKTKIYGT